MSKPVAPECRESLDGIGHEHPTPVDLHFAGKGDFQRKIYTPLVFLVWYKRFFIDEDQPAVQAA